MALNILRYIETYGQVNRREESFTPTPSQTVFNIAETPLDPSEVSFILNGLTYETGVDFSVSGTTVTWLNPLVLNGSDLVEIIYFV